MHASASIGVALMSLAMASKPSVTQQPDHKVAGRVVVAASVETVRAALADPRTIARIDNNGTQVQLLGEEGRCTRTRTTVANPIASIAYESTVCPIAGGWHTRLLRSDDLKEFESTWRVVGRADGQTEIHYEVRTIPDLPIPQFVVDRATRASVHSMLINMRVHFEAE